ncbi:hypothetical protein [Trichlorobacter ammonificans]|uniref:GspL periplasmic domain-containing protein n=1 Tax=Trichlorobacter ammonificans TaxID=2916410 RepID=A0ABN8HMH1_9BACT|nr:hypothetical protein [Trichlorobacter ammonificans]CAH2032360.1 conserved protein of unknown function [Trichlorobacter ammonificans]
MAAITAISFESDGIRIVSGHHASGAFVPERALTLAESELDAFLANDRSRSYLVAISPADTLYETVTIPPVEAKLTALVARNEAARNHPELQEFSCAVQVIGDLPVEGRTIRRVACCLVPHDDIQPILEPFIRHNKIVQTMVAAPFALATLLRGLEDGGNGTLLCAFDGGVTKTLFLAEDGAVVFARSIASAAYGWDLFDRQNVTMTLDYCFQTLRMRPERVIALNMPQEDDPEGPPPRMTALSAIPGIVADAELLQHYLVPLALATLPVQASGNLLPAAYSMQIAQQGVLRQAKRGCLVVLALLLVLVGLRGLSIRELRQDIAVLKRQEASLAVIHDAHQEARRQRDADQPLIAAMNAILAPPDIPRFLVAFERVRKSGATITAIQAARDKDTVLLNVTGTTSSDSYAAAQREFETVLSSLQQLSGLVVTGRQLDLGTRVFTVGATYKP